MQAGYGFEDKYLLPSPTRAILARMLKNLIAVYDKMNEHVKRDRLTRFMEILDGGRQDER
jgi:hypothetical protein